MKALNYEVIRMRGIAFRDEKNVYTKGSDVGYSLGTIEKILARKQPLKTEHKAQVVENKNHTKEHPKKTVQMDLERQNTSQNQRLLDVL